MIALWAQMAAPPGRAPRIPVGPLPTPTRPPASAVPVSETWIFALVFMVAVFAVFSLIVAVQARRRGYSLLVWLVAGMLSNPVFLLILLGVLPDFRRKRLRTTEMDDLEQRLRKPRRSLEETRQPADRPLAQSLGDQPTQAPLRSMGDEETRL